MSSTYGRGNAVMRSVWPRFFIEASYSTVEEWPSPPPHCTWSTSRLPMQRTLLPAAVNQLPWTSTQFRRLPWYRYLALVDFGLWYIAQRFFFIELNWTLACSAQPRPWHSAPGLARPLHCWQDDTLYGPPTETAEHTQAEQRPPVKNWQL